MAQAPIIDTPEVPAGEIRLRARMYNPNQGTRRPQPSSTPPDGNSGSFDIFWEDEGGLISEITEMTGWSALAGGSRLISFVADTGGISPRNIAIPDVDIDGIVDTGTQHRIETPAVDRVYYIVRKAGSTTARSTPRFAFFDGNQSIDIFQNSNIISSFLAASPAASLSAPADIEIYYPKDLFRQLPRRPAPNPPQNLALGLAPGVDTIIATWEPPDTSDGSPPAVTYDLRHQHDTRVWATIRGFTTTFGAIRGVLANNYEVQVRSVSASGSTSAWTPSVFLDLRPGGDAMLPPPPSEQPVPPPPPIVITFPDPTDPDAGPNPNAPAGSKVLQLRAKLGRSSSAFLDQVSSMTGQMILDNADGEFDNLKRGDAFRLDKWLDGVPAEVLHGWVTGTNFTKDPRGQKRAFITLTGSLDILSWERYETALDPVDEEIDYTGNLVEGILQNVNFTKREIDQGQVRVNTPLLYSHLNPARLRTPIGPIRELERTEIGLLHEGRGDSVIFEGRYHRELDISPPRYTFAGPNVDGAIPVEGIVPFDSKQQDVYTNYRIHAGSTQVLEQQKLFAINNPITIQPIGVYNLRFELVGEAPRKAIDDVQSVTNWKALALADVDVRNDANQQLQVSFRADTTTQVNIIPTFRRTSVSVRILNNTGGNATITKLEIFGRGVQTAGDLAFVDLEDEDSEYEPRSLNLATLLDYRIVTPRDLEELANVLFWRYSRPRPTGKITVNTRAWPILLTNLNISDAVTVSEVVGLPSGVYYVEGLEFEFLPGKDTITITLSRRGARTYLADASTISAVNVPAGSPVLVGVRASGTGSVNVTVDGVVVRTFAVSGDPAWYVHFVPESAAAQLVSASVNRASVLAWRVIGLDR